VCTVISKRKLPSPTCNGTKMPIDDSPITMVVYDLHGACDGFAGMGVECDFNICPDGTVLLVFDNGSQSEMWSSSAVQDGPIARLELKRCPDDIIGE